MMPCVVCGQPVDQERVELYGATTCSPKCGKLKKRPLWWHILQLWRCTPGRLCYLCLGHIQEEERWEVDHIEPKSLGGSNEFDNLAITHRACNRRKQAVTLDDLPSPSEFAQKRQSR